MFGTVVPNGKKKQSQTTGISSPDWVRLYSTVFYVDSNAELFRAQRTLCVKQTVISLFICQDDCLNSAA